MNVDITYFSVYMVELENHNVSLLLHGNNTHTGRVLHHICKSGILLFVYYGEPGIWSRFHAHKNLFYDPVGRVQQVIMSDYNPDDLALLNEDNKVRQILNCSYITLINQKNSG
ncbi:hypothetical protein RF11_03800 [Thelohanellus kitauei]|uniref:Uncharacterized protein n=1 Tax=Thelohanellus kitauei TaxID=669202 RepID=A0A0C2ITZ6_THEKT|nr:hypothetical protein RF11_03800 [Thelohanellus kitauei]